MENEIRAARKQLGGFFKDRREAMGVSQDDMATHLGITANTVKGIESGRFAWDVDLHIKICKLLKINLPYERS